MIPKPNESIVLDRHDGFPRRAVIILVLCVTVNAYMLVNLFPYVGIMVMQLMGLESINETGFYAGYVASAFTFGRFVSGYTIGYISDKVGRKPVLVLGLLSIITFSLAFGFSETFGWAIGSRLLLGLTNGIMAAARTLLRDLCGRKHVVMGMVYMGGARAMALVVGTGIGGLLATPAINYPEVFSPTGLFARYPFLLPNIFGALLAALALPMVIFWLPEAKRLDESQGKGELKRLATEATEEKNNSQRVTNGGSFGGGSGGIGEASPLNGDVKEEETGFCGRGGVMRDWLVLKVLFLGSIVQMIVVGFDEVFPLWMLSTPDVGGLGWKTKEIGEILLMTGIILGVLQFAVIPKAVKAVGVVRWQRAGWVLGAVAFVLVPNSKVLSWDSPSLFVVGVTGSLLVNCCLSAVMITLMVASTNIVPPHHRGKLSGMFNTAESLGRFLGPVFYSTMYAFSISSTGRSYPWMDHRFVFYTSAVAMGLLANLGWRTLTADILIMPVDVEVAAEEETP